MPNSPAWDSAAEQRMIPAQAAAIRAQWNFWEVMAALGWLTRWFNGLIYSPFVGMLAG